MHIHSKNILFLSISFALFLSSNALARPGDYKFTPEGMGPIERLRWSNERDAEKSRQKHEKSKQEEEISYMVKYWEIQAQEDEARKSSK